MAVGIESSSARRRKSGFSRCFYLLGKYCTKSKYPSEYSFDFFLIIFGKNYSSIVFLRDGSREIRIKGETSILNSNGVCKERFSSEKNDISMKYRLSYVAPFFSSVPSRLSILENIHWIFEPLSRGMILKR